MWTVVGLGNPGSGYAETRHNVGFWVLSLLAEVTSPGSGNALRWQEKFGCRFARCTLGGEESVLVLPQLFMNRSGEALAPVMNYFRLKPEQLIVIHDDVDLPPGGLRLRRGGSAAGHHGVEDIVAQLGTTEFYRIRVGIGRPTWGQEVTSWVLGRPDDAQTRVLLDTCKTAAVAVETLIKCGLETAQQRHNRRGSALAQPDGQDDVDEG